MPAFISQWMLNPDKNKRRFRNFTFINRLQQPEKIKPFTTDTNN